MLRGPASGPLFVLPVTLGLAVIFWLALSGRWLALVLVVGLVIGIGVWDRLGPQRPAGRVERSWPWHES